MANLWWEHSTSSVALRSVVFNPVPGDSAYFICPPYLTRSTEFIDLSKLTPPLWINRHPNPWVLSRRWNVDLIYIYFYRRPYEKQLPSESGFIQVTCKTSILEGAHLQTWKHHCRWREETTPGFFTCINHHQSNFWFWMFFLCEP